MLSLIFNGEDGKHMGSRFMDFNPERWISKLEEYAIPLSSYSFNRTKDLFRSSFSPEFPFFMKQVEGEITKRNV
ncbi:hypothetical protein CFP56_013070 [Quercus suber]|uniref:Uncharacterized protein n=1 Tax=Quercus suber TaxID=58331 RepID=A0AAW0M485_QUESU